jgi:hypothetical protein
MRDSAQRAGGNLTQIVQLRKERMIIVHLRTTGFAHRRTTAFSLRHGGRYGDARHPVSSNNSRPISMRRISLVPAPIS